MKQKPRHGAHVSAPAEEPFVPGQSEPPKHGGEPGFFRALWSLTKLGAGILLVIAVSGAVAWGAHRYALTTPRFAIKKLDVEGSRRLTDEQVATLAGVKPGDNIFKLDTAAAELAGISTAVRATKAGSMASVIACASISRRTRSRGRRRASAGAR